MVAHFARIVLLVLFPALLMGQSLELSVQSPTTNNSTSTFALQDGEVTIRSNGIRFLNSSVTITGYENLGISSDGSVVSILKRREDSGEMLLFNAQGDSLLTYETVMLNRRDPSLAVYPFDNGGVVLRDNIANFTFYNSIGDISANLSSSSETKGGEAIAQVAMSPNAKTVIIYNPKVKRGDKLGSKAEVKVTGGDFKSVFHSLDRYIKDVNISDDGNAIAITSTREGTDDQVVVMDKYGNVLNTFTTDETLVGTTLSENSRYISLYSGGRVMVYSTLEGERLGATSFRESVYLADYFPEDNLILALTGSYDEDRGVLSDIEFKAIDLERREITSKGLESPIGITDAISLSLVRLSEGKYQLNGSSKIINIEARF